MTEEKIKEEFERFGDYPVDARIQLLVKDIASKSPYCIKNTKQQAIGFIYGVMSAERLSKIEMLEEVLKKLALQDTPVPVHCDFTDYKQGACDNVNEAMRMVNEFLTKLKGV